MRASLLPYLITVTTILFGSVSFSSESNSELRSAKKRLQAAQRAQDADAIAMCVEEIGLIGTPDAKKTVLAVGERFAEDPIRTSVWNALAWANDADVFEFYATQLEQNKPQTQRRRLLIVEALRAVEPAKSVPVLASSLAKSDDSTVQAAVVRALRTRAQKDSVEALIRFYDRIQEQRDRVWQETLVSLKTLTDEEYLLGEDWKSWWAINRATWRPRNLTPRRKQKASTTVYRPEEGSIDLPTLFGLEVASKKIVFVIDCSLSMEELDEIQLPESGRTEKILRMNRARNELSKVIDELRPDVDFAIIAYSSEVQRWKEDLVKATPANKRKALRFVDQLTPTAFTNTEEALLQAIEVQHADTLVLISDGSPTNFEGEVVDIEPILESIREANRFTMKTIHTLGFKGVKVSFMRSLARQHGGSYAPIN